MRKWFVLFISLFFVLSFLSGCSAKPSLELVDAEVDIVKDKNLVGAIGITEGEKKGEELIPTALIYAFTIKNNGNEPVGSIEEADKGIELKIEPKSKLKSVSKDVIGFNIYNPDDYNESGVGFGQSQLSIINADHLPMI
ncbi:hypothetical protein ABE28_024180 (plasmid) [Peribacillus muralis]|uniref:Uncharacterized protein n=1 Tax=Peribacillus muralis TaxID=264697 RepID=A0A1B3XW78_9BACI|nr:hypothetical protein [Peribacillus muralis]AOH57449.1 hypothetical protein ABE28_024180 [Peribacillus muralis]